MRALRRTLEAFDLVGQRFQLILVHLVRMKLPCASTAALATMGAVNAQPNERCDVKAGDNDYNDVYGQVARGAEGGDHGNDIFKLERVE